MPNGEAPRRGPEVVVDEAAAKPAKDDDWGTATQPGAARETKIALVMIVVLCSVFGYVFYRKYDQQKAELATVKAERRSEGEGIEPTDPKKDAAVKPVSQESEGDAFAGNVRTTQARRPARSAPDFGGEPQEFTPPSRTKTARRSPAGDDNPFDGGPAAARPRTVAKAKAPPAEAFDPGFEEPPAAPAQGEPDEFDVSGAPAPPGRSAAQPPPADFEDPLGGNVAGASPLPPAGRVAVDSGAQVTGLEAGAGEFETVRPNPRGTPIPRGRAIAAQPADEFGPQPQPRPTPRPSTAQQFEEFDPSPRATARAPARAPVPTAHPLDAGSAEFQPPAAARPPVGAKPDPFAAAANDPRPTIYEVQPNDNYWVISKKQYGTYRYFAALHRFNAERIPDATKLRPGMKVMTPPPQTLEARYPDLFGKKAGAYAVEEGGQGPGFFRGQTGQPLYRIGEKDTLTNIASNHLGRTSRWIQIFEMNRDQLKTPENLKVGTVLRLPLDASAVRLSARPAETR